VSWGLLGVGFASREEEWIVHSAGSHRPGHGGKAVVQWIQMMVMGVWLVVDGK
jgi:hypothetical protein